MVRFSSVTVYRPNGSSGSSLRLLRFLWGKLLSPCSTKNQQTGRDGSGYDSFGGLDGFGLALVSIVLQNTGAGGNRDGFHGFGVSAVRAVSVVTANPLKLNHPFRHPDDGPCFRFRFCFCAYPTVFPRVLNRLKNSQGFSNNSGPSF